MLLAGSVEGIPKRAYSRAESAKIAVKKLRHSQFGCLGEFLDEQGAEAYRQ